ncbi:MAG: peptide chain release factor N(5)-glutamine methyltransferase [Bacteroidota bacterium]
MNKVYENSLPAWLGCSIEGKQTITYPANVWYERTYQQLIGSVESPSECKSITTRLIEDFLNYSSTRHIKGDLLSINLEEAEDFQQALDKLKAHYPIQYVLGYADFAGYRFHVNPNVLIPRPETEEMVAYIIKQCNTQRPRILDIGTGSGCIAITLAKAFPDARVTGLDISSSALSVARHNTEALKVHVDWRQHDLLEDVLPSEKEWNIIVSNPPYIPAEEKHMMAKRVIDHEPHDALFVPQENALLFYNKIIKITHHHLVSGGLLYLEVHENYAESIHKLLIDESLFTVKLHRDMQGKKRWIEAKKYTTISTN